MKNNNTPPTEQELQEAQELIPRPDLSDTTGGLHLEIQRLNTEINEANEAIGFHHNQVDTKKELKATLEEKREQLMKKFREKLGEQM